MFIFAIVTDSLTSSTVITLAYAALLANDLNVCN